MTSQHLKEILLQYICKQVTEKTENLTNLFNVKCRVKICRSISFLYILHIYEVTGYFSHLHVLICLLIVMPAVIIFIVDILIFFQM